MGKIKIKEENKGKFSDWARARGMSVQAAAAMVLRNRERYSPALIKRANFARNAAKWEEGGMIGEPDYTNMGIGFMNTSNFRKDPNSVTNILAKRLVGNPLQAGKNSDLNKRNRDIEQYAFDLFKEQTGRDITKKDLRKIGAGNFVWGELPKQDNKLVKNGKYSKGGKVINGVATIGIGDMEIKKGKMTIDDLPNYSLGGNIAKTLGGVGIGVAGVLASPFTGGSSLMMIPAGANMAVEGIGGFTEDAQAKRDATNNIQNMGNTQQNAIGSNYVPTFKTGGRFKGKKFGFKPGEQNAIVGGDELVITPDNVVTRMKGPTDMNGGPGIETQLPNNTRIINKDSSKKLLPLVNKMNKDREILSGNSTRLAKNSAKRNLTKRLTKVNDVYNEQELAKFDGGGTYKLKTRGTPGGYTYDNSWDDSSTLFTDKYKINSVLNNIHPGMSEWANPIDFKVTNPTYAPDAPSTTRDVIYAPPAHGEYSHLGTNLRKTGLINKPDITPNKLAPGPAKVEQGPASDNKWAEAATMIGEMAPTLFNLFSGKAKGIDERRYKNWNEGEVRSKLANRRYNIDPELAANEATFRTTAANMRNLGGSRGQVMSNVVGAQNAKQFGDMAAWSKKNNMDNQYRGEEANMLYGLGRDDLSGRLAHDEAEAMDYASWYNNKASAMTGVQNYLLQRRFMKNQANRDKLIASAIKSYGSGYGAKWVPGMDEFVMGQNKYKKV